MGDVLMMPSALMGLHMEYVNLDNALAQKGKLHLEAFAVSENISIFKQ